LFEKKIKWNVNLTNNVGNNNNFIRDFYRISNYYNYLNQYLLYNIVKNWKWQLPRVFYVQPCRFFLSSLSCFDTPTNLLDRVVKKAFYAQSYIVANIMAEGWHSFNAKRRTHGLWCCDVSPIYGGNIVHQSAGHNITDNKFLCSLLYIYISVSYDKVQT